MLSGVSSHFNGPMGQNSLFQGNQNWQRNMLTGRQGNNSMMNPNWGNQAQIGHPSIGDTFQNRINGMPALQSEQDIKNFDSNNALMNMRNMNPQQYQDQMQPNVNRMQVSSITSRSQSMNSNGQNFQMQSQLKMLQQMDPQGGEFFPDQMSMGNQQGPNNFMNPNMMRTSQFIQSRTQLHQPVPSMGGNGKNLLQQSHSMSSDVGFNNPEVFQQPQPPLIPRYPNRGSEGMGGDKSQKDMQNDKDQSNELD